jgi:hypothetical protein
LCGQPSQTHSVGQLSKQTFSKSPRLELIPHFIHPKDTYRRNLEPMNVTKVFQFKKNSKKIERRKEKKNTGEEG